MLLAKSYTYLSSTIISWFAIFSAFFDNNSASKQVIESEKTGISYQKGLKSSFKHLDFHFTADVFIIDSLNTYSNGNSAQLA